jgi:phosphoribosylglycinamide formyltransferase-1
VVLASGNGSNLQAIIDAESLASTNIVAVVSDKPEAFALERARRADLPAIALPCAKGTPRAEYDAALADSVEAFRPDYIFLLGWMRILTNAFLSRFPGKVVNLHPALPGTFAGTRAIERAFEAYQAGNIVRTGVMTHYVPDEGIDCGPVIKVTVVPIQYDDTLESLESRIHEAEHALVLETLARFENIMHLKKR